MRIVNAMTVPHSRHMNTVVWLDYFSELGDNETIGVKVITAFNDQNKEFTISYSIVSDILAIRIKTGSEGIPYCHSNVTCRRFSRATLGRLHQGAVDRVIEDSVSWIEYIKTVSLSNT